jgi:hypothetical protein
MGVCITGSPQNLNNSLVLEKETKTLVSTLQETHFICYKDQLVWLMIYRKIIMLSFMNQTEYINTLYGHW